MQRALIIGATSAIAEETARILAKQGKSLFLVGRNADRLKAMADDLKLRGAPQVDLYTVDLLDFTKHAEIYSRACQAMGGVDLVLIAHGTLGDQKKCEADYALALREYETNFLSIVSILTPIVQDFEARALASPQSAGANAIAVISSVAGDRGRQSNYISGSAKAALSAYLSGLRNRLHPIGIQVLTVKPGFVDTPMTRDFPKGPLFVSPAVIARGIIRALRRQKDVVYLPFFWCGIMFVIRSIPERIFKKLKL